MTRALRFMFAALLLTAPFATAQTASPTDVAKSELRALMTDLNAAMAARDRAALERIYADDFLFVHALGSPVDKKGHIDSAMATMPGPGLPLSSFDGLMVYGNVAIHRRPVDGRFGTTIYVKNAGRWQILQMQGTPIPSTRPTVAVPADLLRSYGGRYEQDNGLFVTITVEGDQLTLQVDGRQKFTLTADAENKFSLPGGGGQFTFTKADDRLSYELVRSNGTVTKGVRVP